MIQEITFGKIKRKKNRALFELASGVDGNFASEDANDCAKSVLSTYAHRVDV